MSSAHDRERRLGGPEHAHAGIRRRHGREPARKTFGLVPLGPRHYQACEPAERRVAEPLARLDLARIEGFAVVRDQRPHYRMLGLVCLQEPEAAAGFTPGPAGNLVQKLESALGRARIAVAEAEIRIDDA